MKTIFPTTTDRVAVVTGGAKGIGAQIVRRFAAAGCRVAFSYRSSQDAAARLLSELSRSGAHAIAVRADLSSPDGAARLREAVLGEFGRPHTLVNNAGSSAYKLLCDMTEEETERMLADNLKSAIYTSRAFYDDFAFGRSGSIINISSVWGLKGASTEAVYSAAKAGVIGFTKALAKELAPCGVRVNAVAPGAIATDMLSCFSEEETEEIRREIPLGRIGMPDDVASAALFLASDLSSYMTGEVLNVSGGYVI